MAKDVIPIKLGNLTWRRGVAYEPEIKMVNRFFEANPTNMVDQVALLSRPGLTRRTSPVGNGPVNAMVYQSGAFEHDMFVASGGSLYRVKKVDGDDDIVTQIMNVSFELHTNPSIVVTQDYVFAADGSYLYVVQPNNVARVVETPDKVPISYLTYIAGYVVCVVAGSQRFYWIEPGDDFIDPLNFAEAERFPDRIVQAMTLGDQFWLFGAKSSEMWYLTGQPEAPMMRVQGRAYDRGSWEGTAVRVGDAVILVGDDGKVYSVEGGPKRISYNGLEERIRQAMVKQEQGAKL